MYIQVFSARFKSFMPVLGLLFTMPAGNAIADWGAEEQIGQSDSFAYIATFVNAPDEEHTAYNEVRSVHPAIDDNGNGVTVWEEWIQEPYESTSRYWEPLWPLVYKGMYNRYVNNSWATQERLFEGNYGINQVLMTPNGTALAQFDTEVRIYNPVGGWTGGSPIAGRDNHVLMNKGSYTIYADTPNFSILHYDLANRWRYIGDPSRHPYDYANQPTAKRDNLKLSLNSAGAIFAVWREESVAGSEHYNLKASHYQPGNRWSIPVIVDNDEASVGIPQDIKIDEAGNAIVIWSKRNPNNPDLSRIYANRYEFGAWQGAGIVIWKAKSNSTELSMDKLGNAYLLWYLPREDETLKASVKRYTADGGWNNHPIRVWTRQFNTVVPSANKSVKLVTDDKGNAVVVWAESNGRIRVRRYDSDVNYWRRAMALRQEGEYSPSFNLVGNDTGVVFVSYKSGSYQAAVQRFDGENLAGLTWNWGRRAWSTPTEFDMSYHSTAPKLAINARGDAMAAWVTGPGLSEVWSRVYHSESSPGAISILSYEKKKEGLNEQ